MPTELTPEDEPQIAGAGSNRPTESRIEKLQSRSALLDSWLAPQRWRVRHWIIAVVWLSGMLAVQWNAGQLLLAQTNPDLTQADQGAYLRMARESTKHWWPTYTDGVRNPLFPWLLKPVVAPKNEEFFASAKQVNLTIGVIITAALGIFFLTQLPLVPALNVTTLGALVAILPLSTFVGSEVLFYGFFFCLWVSCWHLLVRNPIWGYAIAGFIAALAYLAKPSTLLLLLVFFGLSVMRALYERWRKTASPEWSWKRLILGTFVFYLCFLLPVLPRAFYAARVYGDPFQSVAHYCFWEDNWADCYKRISFFNKKKIGQLPPEQRPSASNWLRHHTFDDAVKRLRKGTLNQCRKFFLPEGRLWEKKKKKKKPDEGLRLTLPWRGIYPIALLAGAVTVACFTRSQAEPAPEKNWRVAGWWLLACAFSAHFLAFAWYTPIAPGPRFMLTLWIPVLFTLAALFESLRKKCQGEWRETIYHGMHLAIAAALIVHLIILASTTRFGELRGAF